MLGVYSIDYSSSVKAFAKNVGGPRFKSPYHRKTKNKDIGVYNKVTQRLIIINTPNIHQVLSGKTKDVYHIQ